ncbi:hypothetical protein AALP_AAs43532U000300 [Arabis alpina]|uniref:Uncharacterized protein n=1 Tax=Arabis alpina TaxID=50452 RepID=A0A087FY88_ARAAL|nr:hypothetical protein AALP_AAs43532U000300 [Arabis alpina]
MKSERSPSRPHLGLSVRSIVLGLKNANGVCIIDSRKATLV